MHAIKQMGRMVSATVFLLLSMAAHAATDSQSSQAVSHGSEDSAGAIDAGRCAEPARLAHLPCTGSAADRACQGSRSIFGAFASKTRSRARRWCS